MENGSNINNKEKNYFEGQTDPSHLQRFKGESNPLLDFENWYVVHHGYLACVVCFFGIVANALNIVVLTRKNMKSATNCILTGLALSDGLTMLAYFPFALHFYVLHEPKPNPLRDNYVAVRGMQFYACFSVVVHSISIWLTVVLAVFRYVTVKFPVYGSVWCRVERARVSVVLVFIVTTFLCIPNIITVTIKEIPFENEEMYFKYASENDMNDTNLHQYNETYWAVDFNRSDVFMTAFNFWIQALLVKLMPCCGLTVLSILLIKTMREAEKKRRRLMERRPLPSTTEHGRNSSISMVLLNTPNKISCAQTILNDQKPGTSLQGSFKIASDASPQIVKNLESELGGIKPDECSSQLVDQPMTLDVPLKIRRASYSKKSLKRNSASSKKSLKHDNASSRRLGSSLITKRNTNRTTKMLVTVVVLFLITEFSQGVLNLISGFSQNFVNNVYIPLGDFLDILALINNAINFILYCSMSKQFRDTFLKIFCNCKPCGSARGRPRDNVIIRNNKK